MIGATHAAMTKAVVEALNWPGDWNLVARSAILPDDVQTIGVEQYGCHLLGKNLAALVHFAVPSANGHYNGYCWMRDSSVPHVDLSKVQVIPHPEAWGFPIVEDPEFIKTEPFSKLVIDLSGHASLQADEFTYSTCAVMGEWAFNCYRKVLRTWKGKADYQMALDTLAGEMYHLLVEDPVVPYHGAGVMLDGHSAFEGDVDECYKEMEGSGEVALILKGLIAADNKPNAGVRTLAETLAQKAYVSPRRLAWRRCFWRRGWNKAVRACVLQGLTGSVQLGKLLMAEKG